MRCAICYRQAKGFGWQAPHIRIHLQIDVAPALRRRFTFCSMRCQAAFSRIVIKTEGRMIDPSELELAALQSCLAPLGDYVGAIGMDRPLADYSKREVQGLVETIVSAYQEYMIDAHEQMAKRDLAFLEERLAASRQNSQKNSQQAPQQTQQHGLQHRSLARGTGVPF
ncbi:DUF6511 domain-containing protein [Undibacterium sp. Rencai35W]|uniref:DUF6511 domain-containing protein n=1 Tax=Undibacterium sp. Rencai35W TaxID=3413046 RepID=UPI003BF2A72E